ncbi:MAG: YegS/Rv2252/BmrU family lipid kinase [Cyanobacteria bacterium P01_A01_bin.84]
MSNKACLIFNPISGQGDPEQDLQKIQEILSRKYDLTTKVTTKEIGSQELAYEAVKEGANIVIASGGDGTVSTATLALINTDISFGVIPRGTANAFASALGIPDTIEEACETVMEEQIRKVDVAKCNNKPMLLLAGIGFEAKTIEAASRELKTKWGILAYLLSGLQQLRDFDMFEAEIETDEKIIRTSAAAITVANTAPPTSVLAQGPAGVIFDDGYLDLTIVAPTNWTGAIAASYHLLQTGLRGDAAIRDDIGYIRTKRVKITTKPEQKVVLDGEVIGTTPLNVECIQAGLNVCVPMLPEPEVTEKLQGLPDLEIEIK